MNSNLRTGIPVHDGKRFTWARNERGHVGLCEASDLGNTKHLTWTSAIYKDACDLGFYILSHKTGVKKLFCMVRTIQHEGEVQGWVFESASGDNIEIHVEND